MSCKVESRVGAPREGPCFLLISLNTSFSLLHGSVFDQSNGIFSTTRVLDGRDSGDIGHFLVAIRQWKPPTVKNTTDKEKKERNTRGVKVLSLCMPAGYSLTFSISRLHHRHRIIHCRVRRDYARSKIANPRRIVQVKCGRKSRCIRV